MKRKLINLYLFKVVWYFVHSDFSDASLKFLKLIFYRFENYHWTDEKIPRRNQSLQRFRTYQVIIIYRYTVIKRGYYSFVHQWRREFVRFFTTSIHPIVNLFIQSLLARFSASGQKSCLCLSHVGILWLIK